MPSFGPTDHFSPMKPALNEEERTSPIEESAKLHLQLSPMCSLTPQDKPRPMIERERLFATEPQTQSSSNLAADFQSMSHQKSYPASTNEQKLTGAQLELQTPSLSTPRKTRNTDRSLKDVIEKVTVWRRLYTGIWVGNEMIRYSLDDAARKVNVSKKSLDDYLHQIKLGRKYGFDFKKHQHEKVGVLRKFLRKTMAKLHSSEEDDM